MNPIAYLKGFAWISIVALSCSIFSDFWLPMLVGAAVINLLIKVIRRAEPAATLRPARGRRPAFHQTPTLIQRPPDLNDRAAFPTSPHPPGWRGQEPTLAIATAGSCVGGRPGRCLSKRTERKTTMSPMLEEMLVTEVVPRLRHAARSISKIGSEDDEEIAQDAILMAARMMESAERAGRIFTAGSVSYCAARAARSCRRSYYSGRSDVFSAGCQIDGKARQKSLDDDVAFESGDAGTLHDVIASTNTNVKNVTRQKRPRAISAGNP